MSSALDMSLDDLIKSNKKPSRGGRGGTSSGPQRRAPNRSANRSTPYTVAKAIQKAPETTWQHDMYDERLRDAAPPARPGGIETGTKLYISNLDYGVSNEDIKELFSEVGDLKRSAVHYDRSGRSKGTAEVVFARRADAVAAVKRYNNVQLDGKPVMIELIGTNLVIPAKNPQPMSGIPENAIGASGRGRGRAGAFRRGRSRGRGRGRGRQRQRGEEKSAEDLDAELENYHAEAMQTS